MKTKVFVWESDPLQGESLVYLYQQAGFDVLWEQDFKKLKLALKSVQQQTSLVICSSDQVVLKAKRFKELLVLVPLAIFVALMRKQDFKTRLEVMQAGITLCIDQPIHGQALIAQSQALIRHSLKTVKFTKRPSYSATLCRYGPFSLNLKQFRVEMDCQQIVLKPRAFELFSYFCQHANRLLSREELSQALWQSQQQTGSRHLDNLTLYLRQQLPPHPDFEIETVYKLGYVFHLKA